MPWGWWREVVSTIHSLFHGVDHPHAVRPPFRLLQTARDVFVATRFVTRLYRRLPYHVMRCVRRNAMCSSQRDLLTRCYCRDTIVSSYRLLSLNCPSTRVVFSINAILFVVTRCLFVATLFVRRTECLFVVTRFVPRNMCVSSALLFTVTRYFNVFVQ